MNCRKIVPETITLTDEHPWVAQGFRRAGDRLRCCATCGRVLVVKSNRLRAAFVHVPLDASAS